MWKMQESTQLKLSQGEKVVFLEKVLVTKLF